MAVRQKIILAIAIPAVFLAIVTTVLIIIFWPFSTPSREAQRDRTTDTWSFEFESMDEKLQAIILKAVATMPYLVCENTLENIHKEIIEAAHAYEPYSLASDNGAYILQTEKTEDDTGVYVSFFVALNGGSVVFRCPDKYRAMDLKSIAWGGDSREIVVVSSDVGTYRYALPKPLTYEVRARLHESMPEYRFVATGIAAGTEEWSMGFVMTLDVFDENGLSILSMDYSEEIDGEIYGSPVYLELMDTMGLHVTDVNFDGYKDLIILTAFAGTYGNTWYDCWLWDAKSSAFVFSESFSKICNPSIDREKQRIFSTGGSGAAFWGGSIYKFIDGEFVITNNLDTDCTGLVETQLVNGKMEIVREIIYSDDMQILNSEVDREVAYYKNHELWQLEHPRWIRYGGHHADEWLAE
jgi:hypothetical protein